MSAGNTWARRFATGLLGRARALFHGLGRNGEHPSREVTPEIDRALHAALRGSTEYLGPIE